MDFRRWLVEDAARLRSAASASPQAPVPTCPGWVARDVVDHVGEVYAHKVAVLRLGRAPVEGEWPWAPDDDTVFAWYDDRLTELLRELDGRDLGDPAWTSVAADQTVGFWCRRMAHETAIHRVDAELANGVSVAPHADAQAVDGVGELLGLSSDPSVLAEPNSRIGSAGTVLVTAGTSSLVVTMADDGQSVLPADDQAIGDAYIRGTASDVYLRLWNRPPSGDVTRDGDSSVLQRLDARLALGMS